MVCKGWNVQAWPPQVVSWPRREMAQFETCLLEGLEGRLGENRAPDRRCFWIDLHELGMWRLSRSVPSWRSPWRAALREVFRALQGTSRLRLPYMALRGCEVVVLVERQGEYKTEVVCDACAIMRALQRTSVQTAGPCCHSVTGWNLCLPGDFSRQIATNFPKVVVVGC